MRLSDILSEHNFRSLLEEMVEPETSKPPREKGSDAIKVGGYFVHGHWRRRVIPVRRKKLRLVPGVRRNGVI